MSYIDIIWVVKLPKVQILCSRLMQLIADDSKLISSSITSQPLTLQNNGILGNHSNLLLTMYFHLGLYHM